MFEDRYKTIEKGAEAVFKDRGSRFIGLAFHVKTEGEVKGRLEELRKEYHDATHHCYAYRLGFDKSVYRTNDDGEPSGTAGKPIFNQILSKDLTNILIVVVRYFGGTKLGVSGLVNAYKTTAKDVLEKAVIVERKVHEVYELDFGYEIMNGVMKLIKDEGIRQVEHVFEESCNIVIEIPRSNSVRVVEKFKAIQGLEVKFLKIE